MLHANTNLSFENFLNKTNFIPNKYALLNKISRQKLKFKSESWITPGMKKPT